MGVFRLFVRFPDGEVWHGAYDSVTDTAARFLCPADEGPYGIGWAMDEDYEPTLDGTGEPVQVATDYDDVSWPGTAVRVPGPGHWCWLTSGWQLPNGPGAGAEGRPGWLTEHQRREAAKTNV